MPLEDMGVLMRRASRGGYALGYFESWNLESLQGVIDAAEQSRSPVIIGFNGGFLSSAGRHAAEKLAWYAALGRAAAGSASVPCGLLFNECPSDEWVRQAIAGGFNLVMPADPEAPFDRYTLWVAELTRLAHSRGVAVEAEIGELPAGLAGHGSAGGTLTDPYLAGEFAETTGIDLLAVSVGNVHVKVDGTQDLDLRRLEQVHARVKIPLALHGGTGISATAGREARSPMIALTVPQQVAARRMEQSKQSIPHFYLQTSASAEAMVARRQTSAGEPVAWDAFFVHAAGKALRRFERLTYRFEQGRLVSQGADAVCLAVDVEGDLFTLAIEHPADKALEAISGEIAAGVTRLRSGDPRARMAQKACLTVSNLGGSGIESFAAVINPPESAILAVGKVMPVVTVVGGQVAVQNRVNLTLSVDHRVASGKYAAEFFGAIVRELERR